MPIPSALKTPLGAESKQSRRKGNLPVIRKATKTSGARDHDRKMADAANALDSPMSMLQVAHQFSLVEGCFDSKERRLMQLLERLPAGNGAAIIFVEPQSASKVQSIVAAYNRRAGLYMDDAVPRPRSKSNASDVSTDVGSNSSTEDADELCHSSDAESDTDRYQSGSHSTASTCNLSSHTAWRVPPSVRVAPVPSGLAEREASQRQATVKNCRYVINYDLPASGREYTRRLAALSVPVSMPGCVYTLVGGEQLRTRRCREIVGVLRRARRAAVDDSFFGGPAKVTELDSALQQLSIEEENEDEIHDETCCCPHCSGRSIGGTTFHSVPGSTAPRVEVVRIPFRALENLDAHAPLIAPRLHGYACTVIGLHCMTDHTPWDGWEHLFALPEGMGTVRVILVLAEKGSWHTFPDHGTFRAGVAWLDILDVESMHRTDRLLERLVDHEIALLHGESERIVLFGTSQGGGQSMMRFLRSRHLLGGWIGSVCHVPTAPHMPRDCDPLLFSEALVNRDRPMRLLAGEADVVFPPQLVLHDAERLQDVGRFTDVKVVVEPCMSHEGWLTATEQRRQGIDKKTTAMGDTVGGDIVCENLAAWETVPELVFLQRHLPSMVPERKVYQPREPCLS